MIDALSDDDTVKICPLIEVVKQVNDFISLLLLVSDTFSMTGQTEWKVVSLNPLETWLMQN